MRGGIFAFLFAAMIVPAAAQTGDGQTGAPSPPAPAAAPDTPTAKGPITPPTPANDHSAQPGDYPLISRSLGEQGSVLLRYVINVDGTVGDVQVMKSSGFPRLDAASIDMAKQRWRFHPAMQDGKPIVVSGQVNVTWQLIGDEDIPRSYVRIVMKPEDFPPGAKEQHEEGIDSIFLVVDEKGNIVSYEVRVASGFPDLDAATRDFVTKHWHFTPATLDGKPIKSWTALNVIWSLDPIETLNPDK